MPIYRTPGVHVEEVSTLPPSVAEVSTAIPVFIGTTTRRPAEGPVAQVRTMLEYEQLFGEAPTSEFRVSVKSLEGGGHELLAIERFANGVTPKRLMNHAMRHYFANGGGRCYVISVGSHEDELTKERFFDGLARLEREDEPTIIVMPQLVELDTSDATSVGQRALMQCDRLGDRFCIFDVADDAVDAFRDGIGNEVEQLKYGAAYFPFLRTTLGYRVEDAAVTIVREGGESPAPEEDAQPETLADLRNTDTALYNAIKKALAKQRVTLPPSPAMAGIYARVDASRGVWKAPANVSVASVLGPTTLINDGEQEQLNVHETGKSINAIRAFAGKGTLVWGARTLAGNDNEWRYIPVRRLFNTIEESAKKATSFAVFEPNDASTWLKVKGMLDSYLFDLWEQGALQGSTPESAYFVNVGLGKTMTSDDVLNGRMIVEIGVAAVRPAEFIILRFSHKLTEG